MGFIPDGYQRLPKRFLQQDQGFRNDQGRRQGGRTGAWPPYGSQIYIENLIKFLYKLAWLAPPNNEKKQLPGFDPGNDWFLNSLIIKAKLYLGQSKDFGEADQITPCYA